MADSLKKKLGAPPVDDSLKAVGWMIRALAAAAGEVLEDKRLTKEQRRAELYKIAAGMSQLRDVDRIRAAEETVRGVSERMEQRTRGPELTDAPKRDEQAGRVTARRGRPPRSAIR